jgi:urease accessory protein
MVAVRARDTDLQRSSGIIRLDVGENGDLTRLREEGSAKLRMPARLPNMPLEAVLINTSGGLAGGDRFDVTVNARGDACITTQAAEKIYPSLGSETQVATTLRAEASARLCWLPQEAILFDGARLSRCFYAEVGDQARLLAVESVVLGRKAMGETLSEFSFRDCWRIRRGGRLVFADHVALDGARVHGAAALSGAGAMATLVLIDAQAEGFLGPLRDAIGINGGVTAWDGKLIARLVARDGLCLRKSLVPALSLLAAPVELPKVWSL